MAMASASKRGRASKESDKRGSARKLDETPSIAENRDGAEDPKDDPTPIEEPQTPVEEPAPESSPEVVYEEPVLTKLIVEKLVTLGLYTNYNPFHF